MSVMEEERNRANVKQEGTASTKTDDLEAMPSGPQPVLTQKSLAKELPTAITNVAHIALTQGLEVLSDLFEGGNSNNKEFERVKEKRDPLL